MTSDRIDELIALASLGELSEAERMELDEAATSDPVVGRELAEALATAAALQKSHAEQPPAALRDSVLAAIASTPQEVTSAPADLEPPPPPAVSLDVARRRRVGPVMLAAVAAVVLLVAGGVVLVATNDGASDPIAAVVEAPDATSRQLDGVIENLTVVYSPSEQAIVVEGEAVPLLDDTATYQLWLVGDGEATSVGVFRPGADGTVAERFAATDPTDFVLGVTREPAGGSDSPTLPILASA